MRLLTEALIKFTCGVLMVGLLIFLPAGTFSYLYGWLLIGLLFAPMLVAGLVMLRKSPDFLKRRIRCQGKTDRAERRCCLLGPYVRCRFCGGGS